MKKFLSHVLTLVILLTMVMTPKFALAADSPTNIGDNYIESYDALATSLSSVATVEQDSSTDIITVTLNKDIIGRIEFAIFNAHIIFNANGHTVDGGTQNQGICLVHFKCGTVELIGGGTYKTGIHNAIYVGFDNTLVIKDAIIEGNVVNDGGVINDQRQHNHTCADSDSDHDCDECGGAMGIHIDENKDHICDYGCSVAIDTCEDANKDHTCDYGCGKSYGTHEDADKNHNCDYGCSVTIATCEDKDKDHTCDYGCLKEYGTHAQTTGKHTCDYCGATMSDCSGGTATCTKKAICSVCGAEYGELLQHTYGTDWKSDKDNHWHECACGDGADTAAHTPKVVNAKESTTSEKGYTGDTVCEVCGYEIAKGEDIPVKATPTEPDNNNTTNDEPTSPQTGDKSNIFLWVALLFVSGVGLMSATVLDKKSKVNR